MENVSSLDSYSSTIELRLSLDVDIDPPVDRFRGSLGRQRSDKDPNSTVLIKTLRRCRDIGGRSWDIGCDTVTLVNN